MIKSFTTDIIGKLNAIWTTFLNAKRVAQYSYFQLFDINKSMVVACLLYYLST